MALPQPTSAHGGQAVAAKCLDTARIRADFTFYAVETELAGRAAIFETPHQNRTVRNLPPDAMALFAGYLKVPPATSLAVAKLARAIHE
jgi:hypothetical protein